ncbi:cytochrome c [Wenyingzhuangia sp. 2_MG-2023]|uniref:c-type cytochrome n=1 Tax=Wenyingzhuangia sp. 2_MG-2023 TaxID=3062639 RepID=UPI0026E249F6|nr:cytochrome c [Wenyingzhuangia sp. 2_MG-2023]MDO6738063.1 cytochrome c [Wenyingzhuangia sp. 2_MG-2023]
MSRLFKITTVLAVVTLVFTSCDKSRRQLQFMPDMYQSVSGEPYEESTVFENGLEAQQPVSGSISRGHIPYEYPDTNEGYEDAKKKLKSPLTAEDLDSEQAKNLYTIYCSVCHGKKGDGQGDLVKREKFLGIPNYKDRDVTEGSIYHVIMHGKNMMGSHASQLNEKERWLIVKHVQELRNNLLK